VPYDDSLNRRVCNPAVRIVHILQTPTLMKLTIRNLNLAHKDTLDAFITNRLVALCERVRIDDAQVLLERRSELRPPFRISLHVAVPGPDLHAEHVANTPLQAFTAAFEMIEKRLRLRALNRIGQTNRRDQRTAGSRMTASRAR
jgi:ribosome-associated translation inhibitor RaiA